MEQIADFFQYLTNSEEIIQTGGLIAIVLIVYIENGLFFGFFLPGDYLLFLSGVFCGLVLLKVNIFLLLISVFLAAVLGSFTGYISGYYFGEALENKKENLFFKKKHINRTKRYFEKYGSRTLIIARFLPIVRTFAPIMAGLVKMKIIRFWIYNILGGAIWVLVLVGGGYYFGVHFPWIIDYVHYIIVFFLVITSFTVIKGYFSAKEEIEQEK
ncbi:DedA family protein [Arcticibacterium luteifluviistationis]|uniref:Alkaline phosphatase n=1 Tax=Arcticibacterium luteifluviistationis TaxID=1784714 RepID=A0A2Z4GH87_9BACT|nr:DedA family protein [Arcticibacterium luteifluviistationis]AWW00617.1 alkaline phosphatase [Arcticibacterium luteifluviistationis]